MKKVFGILAIIVIILFALNSLGVFDNNTSTIPPNSEVCRVCEGSKKCSVCDGDGVLELPGTLGGSRKCSFCASNPGVCRTCKGTGYMIVDD